MEQIKLSEDNRIEVVISYCKDMMTKYDPFEKGINDNQYFRNQTITEIMNNILEVLR